MRLRLSLATILLISIALASLGDEWDPGDNDPSGATLLDAPAGAVLNHGPHDFSDSDGADWFQVTLDAGTEYSFRAESLSGTIGGLYDAGGENLLLRNVPDPIISPNLDFDFTFTPESTGLFFLRVEPLIPGDTGEYELLYSQVLPLLDEWDPLDDAIADGTPLGIPPETEANHGPHSLGLDDLEDWFQFDLEAGRDYVFRTAGQLDTAADLFFGDAQNRVAANDNRNTDVNAKVIFHAETAGVYFLRVRLSGTAESGGYELRYQGGEGLFPAGDEWDHADDVFEGAAILADPTGDVQSHGPHTFDELDEFDWFGLLLEEGHIYQFSSVGDAQPFVDIFLSDGVTPAFENDTGIGFDLAESVIFTPIDTGKIFIRARDLLHKGGEYTFQYVSQGLPVQPVLDEFDPQDDEVAGASVLGIPDIQVKTHGPHTLSAADLSDWFEFVFFAGDTYEIWSTGGDDPAAVLFAEDGVTPLLQQDDGGAGFNFRIVYAPATTAVHHLRVQMANPGATGEYTLAYRQFVEPPESGDDWDPIDDSPTGATDLGAPLADAQSHGPHGLSGEDVEDWFQFTLSQDTAYDFSSSGDSDTRATLFGPGSPETELVTDDDGGADANFRIRFTPPADGVYFLRVTGFGAERTIYTLQYRGEELPEDVSVNGWMLHE